MEDLQEREENIINIARDFRDFHLQIEMRMTVLESADPRHKSSRNTSCDKWPSPREASPQNKADKKISEETVENRRTPDDSCSKCKKVGEHFKGGIDGPHMLPGWQDKR